MSFHFTISIDELEMEPMLLGLFEKSLNTNLVFFGVHLVNKARYFETSNQSL